MTLRLATITRTETQGSRQMSAKGCSWSAGLVKTKEVPSGPADKDPQKRDFLKYLKDLRLRRQKTSDLTSLNSFLKNSVTLNNKIKCLKIKNIENCKMKNESRYMLDEKKMH